ncbi:unnamed protein product, partial [Symbiodinium sp. CCMP2456]
MGHAISSVERAACFSGPWSLRPTPSASKPSSQRATLKASYPHAGAHGRLLDVALGFSAAAATRLVARRHGARARRLTCHRAETEGEFVAGTSIYDDDGWRPQGWSPGGTGTGTLDMLPKMGVEESEEEKKRKEPTEPAMVLEVRGDLVVVRAGKGLFTQDTPGQIACTDSGADAVLLAWKEDIAILQLLAGEAEPGDEARRVEEKFLMTKCSAELRGRILDPEGRPLDGLPMPEKVESRQIFMKEKPKE